MQGSEADGELGDVDVRPLLLAYPRRRAPRKEFRVAWHIGHKVKNLLGSERDDLPPGMTRDGHGG
jgi:hypothetical protein